MGRTFVACGPFGPWVTSNSTFWFSSRFRYPSPWIALKCTNTSSPSSREMKPYPLSGLNHFTLPVATSNPLLSWPCPDISVSGGLPAGSPARELLEAKTAMRNPHRQYTGDLPDSPECLFEVVAKLLRPGGVAELAQRLGLDLTDPLPGHPEDPADLLEGPRLS